MSKMSVTVSGNVTRVQNTQNQQVYSSLPIGTYAVKIDQHGQYFLEMVDNFQNPSKLYGDTKYKSKRILNTFQDRPAQTGVLLSGEKGSGKTMLARQVSIDALTIGIPTILVSESFCGSNFNQFMQDIHQEVVIIFDEFEKVYQDEDQEKILTLFDGVFQTKKLFIVTINDEYKINFALKNRPGRLYYRFNYKGLNKDFIREYCEDMKFPEKKTEQLIKISEMFGSFNFDLLKAFVEECNRYDEMPIKVMEFINANPTPSGYEKFTYTLFDSKTNEEYIPFRNSASLDISDIDFYCDYKDKKGNKRDTYFQKENFAGVSNSGTEYVFDNGDIRGVFKKKEDKDFDYMKGF